MYYHFCLLCVFRPFVGLALEDSDTRPHEICTQAAQSILALAQSYDDLFTLRRVSGLIPYFICVSGLFSLAMGDKGSHMEPVYLRLGDDGPSMTSFEQMTHDTTDRHHGASIFPSRVKISAATHARLLLAKIGSTHPAAIMADKLLQEGIGFKPGEEDVRN
jgi:hypothetical protein